MKKLTTTCLTTCAAICAVITAAALPALAHADGSADMTPSEISYAQEYGKSGICPILLTYPPDQGIQLVVTSLVEAHFTPPENRRIITYAVSNYCPQYLPTWQQALSSAGY